MIYFISDLHLAPQTRGVTQRFFNFLETLNSPERAAKQLYILGDLFEVWLGDDAIDDPEETYNASIVKALRQVSDNGIELFLMHGNRDFLLGEHFATRCGAKLLPDPYVLSLPTWQLVLAHGDSLCTDDKDYQAFRAQVRQSAWRDAFLAKPLSERKAIAAAMRQQSECSKQAKLQQNEHLMDVNLGETEDFMRTHGYATFIHGHTHRPATHEHLVDGIQVQRWVMSDWHEDKGECLYWDGEQLRREALDSALP